VTWEKTIDFFTTVMRSELHRKLHVAFPALIKNNKNAVKVPGGCQFNDTWTGTRSNNL